jgi:hypothetical protein
MMNPARKHQGIRVSRRDLPKGRHRRMFLSAAQIQNSPVVSPVEPPLKSMREWRFESQKNECGKPGRNTTRNDLIVPPYEAEHIPIKGGN